MYVCMYECMKIEREEKRRNEDGVGFLGELWVVSGRLGKGSLTGFEGMMGVGE